MSFENLPELTGRSVVLTGATGFIGARVLAACIAAGADVTALVRSGRGAQVVEAAGARSLQAGLRDRSALTAALASCDALCHLAHDIRAGEAENLAVFDGILSAAEEAAIGRFIHASSVVVYDDWPEADLTEESPRESAGGGPYRQAKLAMEQKLAASPLPSVVLQPTLVYGPASPLWTDHFANALLGGGILLPTPVGLCNAVYVDDVAQAFVRAIALDEPQHETFLISGAEPVSWRDYLEGYRNIVGGDLIEEPASEIASRLGPEPEASTDVPLAARISAAGRRLLGHERFEALVGMARKLKPGGPAGPLHPDHMMLGLFTARGGVSVDHAHDRLGYVPQYDLPAGMAALEPHLKSFAGT